MLTEKDMQMVELVAGAFREWMEAQKDGENVQSVPRMLYGKELLKLAEDSPEALLWYGFYGGFGAGSAFMATREE